ncbi:MAG: hypothetical protein CHKLHMKO_00438 [Candidatus Argoarchaeum ethanivorans]|uniref:Peptidase A2 domain-containing protein n=1 Tax=Candidatus Argoarchaeum ethanivorans TaxID=2608793 RepID=A0A811TCT7_9EURY|nr:MAG: hypothetical protein CHKLHMKO_00438 [Candidatus Argoarchaeum ethanivorans]
MSRVFQEVKIRSNTGECETKALFDTGADRTFIRSDIGKKVGSLVELSRPRVATLGDGENTIEIKEGLFLELTLGDYLISTDADVSDKLAHELIIGASTMQEWGIVVDPEGEKVVIKDRKTSFELV